MKKYMFLVMLTMMCLPIAAQKSQGKCGLDVHWSFDGQTLTLKNVNKKGYTVVLDNYDTRRNLAPWIKKRLKVRRVEVGNGIERIGSCAFANCETLQEVIFNGTDLKEIGWGAFLNCDHLRNISLPTQLQKVETVAFANCQALTYVKIPDHCRVEDQAYVSCKNLKTVEVAPTALLGHYVFASEVKVDDVVRHSLYSGEIQRLPSYINKGNCNDYGFAQSALEKVSSSMGYGIDYDHITSDIDSIIPTGSYARNTTYALIIGNQNYRWASMVPYAIHDARVFRDYCEKTLGIPASNIHISEDATKHMILEEELSDWIGQIPQREQKNLIVYYAGHGVPDNKDKNKAYLLPTDVRGTSPQRGIALDDFYGRLGALAFNQTTVFLDACFSGVNRMNEGVSDGLRVVEIEAEEAELANGSVVVFSAAQGNETAQGFPQEGHGLFTYYLIKQLQDTYGNITFGQLSDNIQVQVSNQALQLKMRKKQTPTTKASEEIQQTWRDMSF